MVLGHLSATYLVIRGVEKRATTSAIVVAGLMGAYFPDMIDKTAFVFFNANSSRAIAHTLAFNLTFSLALWLVLKLPRLVPYRKIGYWFIAGSFLHLLEDFVDPTVLFYPLLGPMVGPPGHSIWESVVNYYLHGSNIPCLAIELASYMGCAFLFTTRMSRKVTV